jgi:hypothetical protein
VQAFADAHETPVRLLSTTPDGLAVAAIAQRKPFHCSASISRLLELLV